MAPYQILQVARVNAVMQGLQDVREIPQQLIFLNRTPVVPAEDDEIMARFVGHIQIADVIADDAAAVAYSSGKFNFETTNIPNLKHGRRLSQSRINQLRSIQARGGFMGGGDESFLTYEASILNDLSLGINERQEALIVGMQTDSFVYDRLGIKIVGSWGMPADLKVTPSTPWDNTSAVAIDDILNVKLTASVRYGITYNRVTMSTACFNYMTKQTDFITRARTFIYPASPTAPLPFQKTPQMLNLASQVLGMEIELYDARYWSQAPDGTSSSAPYLPITKVILSDSGNDRRSDVMDFANAVTTESIVSGLVPDSPGSFGGPTRGPIGYATAPWDLNPPELTYWGVMRGFPRKKMLQATAVITAGTFSDPIPVGVPF